MFQQADVVVIILLRSKLVIWIDVEWVAGKTFEEIDAFPSVNDLFETSRHMVQRGTWFPGISHLVKAQMDVLQHVGSHVAVQEHERVSRCFWNSKAHFVLWRQVRVVSTNVCHGVRPQEILLPITSSKIVVQPSQQTPV